MGSFLPPNPTAPAPPTPMQMTLAQVSAMGTTAAAPALPGAGAAPAPVNAGPPVGVAPTRPVVAPHAAVRSVGTHGSRSLNRRANAAHGMTKA